MKTRRNLLRSAAALGGAPLMSSRLLAAASSARAEGYWYPEEAVRHERTFMQWPVNRTVHDDADFLHDLQSCIAKMANTVADLEPVVMLAAARHHQAIRARVSRAVELWDVGGVKFESAPTIRHREPVRGQVTHRRKLPPFRVVMPKASYRRLKIKPLDPAFALNFSFILRWSNERFQATNFAGNFASIYLLLIIFHASFLACFQAVGNRCRIRSKLELWHSHSHFHSTS